MINHLKVNALGKCRNQFSLMVLGNNFTVY